MSSCFIIPSVRDKNNNLVESKLFRGLASLTRDRALTEDIYWATKLKEFDTYYPNLGKDDSGEILLTELITKTEFGDRVGIHNIEKALKAEGNVESYYDGLVKADKLNKNNPYAVKYSVAPIGNRLGVAKDVDSSVISKDKAYHEYLRDTLANWGVSVGALTEQEEYLGLNGVTDFSRAGKTLNGLVELIRLAKGEKGENALSEEFAHLALEMLPTPLKGRLYNTITEEKAKEVLGELYDSYLERYGTFEGVQKEVAGKLLSQALENNFNNTDKVQKTLLQRLVQFFKDFFSKFDHFSLLRAKTDIESNFNKLAREILDRGLTSELSLNNITATESLAQLEQVETLESVLTKAIEDSLTTEEKRLLIYKSDEEFVEKQKVRIKSLKDAKASEGTLLYGFMDHVKDAHKDLESLFKRMKNIKGATLEEEAKLLRTIRDYANSYEQTVEYTGDILSKFELPEDVAEPLDELYSNMLKLRSNIQKMWKQQSKDILKRIVQPLMGDEVVVPFGKNAGHKFSIDEMLNEAFEDIGMVERWFLPMNVSSDIILQSIDYTLKDRLFKARLDAVEYERQILAMQEKLGKNTPTDFMFERDNEGNLTGSYITKHNYALYNEAKRKFAKSLNERYGIPDKANAKEILSRKDFKAYRKEWALWKRENETTDEDGITTPSDKYLNPQYTNLTDKQFEYYEAFLTLKQKMDRLLPEGMTDLYNTVKVRAKSGESLSKGDIKGFVKEKISDFALVTGEDSERLGTENALTDFSGNVYRYLPMHYISMGKGENKNSISTDASSSLIIYGNAIARYHQLDQVANTLEVAYQALKQRPVVRKKNGLRLMSMFKNEEGEREGRPIYLDEGSANLIGRLRDYLDKNLYQEGVQDYKKEFGGKVYSLKKANDALMSYTALKGMGLNFASQFANVLNGFSQNLMESMWAKEKMNLVDMKVAHSLYFKNIGDILKYKETGKTTNKLAILLRMLDVNQDWNESINEKYSNTTQLLLKHLNSSLLTIGQGLGDHYLKHMTALSFINHKKLLLNGKEVNLVDAIEDYYIDPKDKTKGMSIRFKEGVTGINGEEVTFDSYLSNTSQQITKLNQRMYGVYNTVDKPALSKYILGNWLLTFRNWLPRMVHARIAKPHYNIAEQEWDQGYYASYAMMVKELYNMKKDIQLLDAMQALLGNKEVAAKLGFDEKTINNVRRSLTDMAFVAFFTILGIMLSHHYGLDEDDKEKRKANIAKMSQFDKYLLYFIVRNEIELGSTSPAAIKITSEQAKQIVSNSFTPGSTAMDLLNNVFSLVYVHDIDGIHVGSDPKLWGKDPMFKEGETPFWKYSKASTSLTRLMFPWVDNTTRLDDPLDQAKSLLIYRK